jgi:hypothetical protein
MKTNLNILSASLVGIVCASIMTPSYAASSVRSLGGAGTYTGTSSVRANVASETSGSAISTARAGSLRVNDASGTRNTNAALRTPSTRSATAPRLSIGKYLAGYNGTGSTGGGSSTKPIVPGQSGTVDTDALKEDLQEWLGTSVNVYIDGDKLYVQVGDQKTEEYDLITQDALDELEDRLNEQISAAGVYVGDDEYISIDDNNTVTAIVGALSGAFSDGLATTADVKEYALPKPDANCISGSTVCVLSVDMDGNYFWLELVDDVDDAATTTVVEPADEVTLPTTESTESYMYDESI